MKTLLWLGLAGAAFIGYGFIKMAKAAKLLSYSFVGLKNWDFKPDQNRLAVVVKMSANNPSSTGILVSHFSGNTFMDGHPLGSFTITKPLWLAPNQVTAFEVPLAINVLNSASQAIQALLTGVNKMLDVQMIATAAGIDIPINYSVNLTATLRDTLGTAWAFVKSFF